MRLVICRAGQRRNIERCAQSASAKRPARQQLGRFILARRDLSATLVCRGRRSSGRTRRPCAVDCGTGVGTAIAANKVRGIRAATAHDLLTLRGSVENYDAQVFMYGAKTSLPPRPLGHWSISGWICATTQTAAMHLKSAKSKRTSAENKYAFLHIFSDGLTTVSKTPE